MSIGREPKSSPPGSDSRTCPQRREQRSEHVDRGPDPLDELVRARPARCCRCWSARAGPARGGSSSTPIAASRSPMIVDVGDVGHVGEFVRRRRPSSVVAISLSTEFLAPGTVTTPSSGPLPRTTITSSWSGASRRERPDQAGSWPTSMLATVEPGGRIVTRRWPDDPVHRSCRTPHDSFGRPDDDVVPGRLVAETAGARWRSRRRRGRSPSTGARSNRTADELVESTGSA